jgi:hypothetical protein
MCALPGWAITVITLFILPKLSTFLFQISFYMLTIETQGCAAIIRLKEILEMFSLLNQGDTGLPYKMILKVFSVIAIFQST